MLLVVALVAVCLVALPTQAEAASSGDFSYSVGSGKATVTRYSGNDSHVTIPSTLGGYPVVALGSSAFYGCSETTTVTVPAGILSIDEKAFYNSTGITAIWVDESNPNYSSDSEGALFNKAKTILIRVPEKRAENYTIPGTVVRIDPYAFHSCDYITEVDIPVSVLSIGNSAFSKCGQLASLTLCEGLTSIGKEAFYECSLLTTVQIPDSVTAVGTGAFEECRNLISVVIGDGWRVLAFVHSKAVLIWEPWKSDKVWLPSAIEPLKIAGS